jgi:galactonate dehydratase
LAEPEGIVVAPHNPSGPIATAASIQTVATISNFAILELAHGEVPWRSDLVTPPEQFEDGHVTVADRPGLGYDLNREMLSKHSL